MKFVRILLLLPALAFPALTSAPAWSALEAAVDDAAIDRLIDAAGVASNVATVPRLITEGVTRGKPDLNDEQRLKLADSLNRGQVTDPLLERVRQSIRAQLDTASYNAIKDWFASDTGKKFIAAETAVSQPDKQKKMQDYVARAASVPIDFDRSDLLRRFDRLTRASATQKIVLDDFIDMLKANTKDETLLKQTRRSVSQAQLDMEDQVMWAMAYAFETMSDDELRRYIAFYQSPAGQQWVTILRDLTRHMWRVIHQTTMDYLKQFAPPAPRR